MVVIRSGCCAIPYVSYLFLVLERKPSDMSGVQMCWLYPSTVYRHKFSWLQTTKFQTVEQKWTLPPLFIHLIQMIFSLVNLSKHEQTLCAIDKYTQTWSGSSADCIQLDLNMMLEKKNASHLNRSIKKQEYWAFCYNFQNDDSLKKSK